MHIMGINLFEPTHYSSRIANTFEPNLIKRRLYGALATRTFMIDVI